MARKNIWLTDENHKFVDETDLNLSGFVNSALEKKRRRDKWEKREK